MPMLPLILIFVLLGLGVVTILGLVAFLTGLLVAIEFLVVTFLILYALYKLDMIDDSYKWVLVAAPFLMFFVGLGLNKAHVLSIQPLTVQGLAYAPLSVESFLLLILVILGVTNIYVEVSEK
jgi:hypothetical protein